MAVTKHIYYQETKYVHRPSGTAFKGVQGGLNTHPGTLNPESERWQKPIEVQKDTAAASKTARTKPTE